MFPLCLGSLKSTLKFKIHVLLKLLHLFIKCHNNAKNSNNIVLFYSTMILYYLNNSTYVFLL